MSEYGMNYLGGSTATSSFSADKKNYYSKRALLQRRLEMVQRRITWWDHWRDLAEQILPRHARFFYTDRWRAGVKKNDKIINASPTKAARVSGAGMMAGFTSPAREWFRLGVPNAKLEKVDRVKKWLFEVEQIMRTMMLRSNFYKVMPQCYLDLLVFGIHCSFIDEDDEHIFRYYPQHVGTFCLAQSHRGVIDTVTRDLSMTVGQVVKQFGFENCSEAVQNMHKAGNQQVWVDVAHIIEPNYDKVSDRMDFQGMPFISHWFEVVNDPSPNQKGEKLDDKILKRSGYREFPAICPRWFTIGEDVYGFSPGMDALGDCRMLQLFERRKMQVIDKIVQPPMVGDPSLRGQRTSLLPADVTYAPGVDKGFKPAIVVHPDAMKEAREEIRVVSQRIDQIFFKDLWVAFLQDDKIQPRTAEEIIRKHEEKLLQLGPVMENIADEALSPSIERIFNLGMRRGVFPPPPPELQESRSIDIEYMNIASVAQKMQGTAAIERTTAFAGSLASVDPEVLDNLDFDQIIHDYADMQGLKPDEMLSPDERDQKRNARRQQQQAQQQGAAMAEAAKGAKNLGTAGDAGQSALANILSNIGKSAPGSVASPTSPVVQGPPGIA